MMAVIRSSRREAVKRTLQERFNLAGNVTIVTGAGSGLCAALVVPEVLGAIERLTPMGRVGRLEELKGSRHLSGVGCLGLRHRPDPVRRWRLDRVVTRPGGECSRRDGEGRRWIARMTWSVPNGRISRRPHAALNVSCWMYPNLMSPCEDRRGPIGCDARYLGAAPDKLLKGDSDGHANHT